MARGSWQQAILHVRSFRVRPRLLNEGSYTVTVRNSELRRSVE